jgi:hypothetical protein
MVFICDKLNNRKAHHHSLFCILMLTIHTSNHTTCFGYSLAIFRCARQEVIKTSICHIPHLSYSKYDIHLRSAPFWSITQRRVVILYRRFGATFRSHLQGSESILELLDP